MKLSDRARTEHIFRSGEMPIINRLSYASRELNSSRLINSFNIAVRNEIFETITSDGDCWAALNDILEENQENDILVSEVDRYGLPLRTVLNMNTGLVRTDPYFSSDYLDIFYSKYYRQLYSNRNVISIEDVFAEQIQRGGVYLRFLSEFIKGDDRVLEIGCGMGGILVPFKLNNFEVTGIDVGSEFIDLGNRFGLNLCSKSIDDIIREGSKYEVVILSHILEHIPKLDHFLGKVKGILTESGKIFISVPGLGKIHETYQSDLHMYLQNAHCWSFTRSTLMAILFKFGFNVLKIDDQVNCVAENALPPAPHLDLRNEGGFVLNYLKRVEKDFLQNRQNSFGYAAFLSSVIRQVKKKFNLFKA